MVHRVVDATDFDEQVRAAGAKLVVVDFFATWCGPCIMIAPFLEELANRFDDDIVVVKVDVDECDELAARFEIESMPTFVFLKNGQRVDSFAGANKQKLEETVARLK